MTATPGLDIVYILCAHVCANAACGGTEGSAHLLLEITTSSSLLTDMLTAAGSDGKLAGAKWLSQQGAGWPAVLQWDDD
jgi:hypothetical protein